MPNGLVTLHVLADGQNEHQQNEAEEQHDVDQGKAFQSPVL